MPSDSQILYFPIKNRPPKSFRIPTFSKALLKSLRFGSSFLEETARKIHQIWGADRGRPDRIPAKNGLIQVDALQQNLQQQGAVRLRSRYYCGTIAIISL